MKFLLALWFFAVGCLPASAANPVPWQTKVAEQFPLLGHRNWIVIVDSAYPLQTSSGIETIETGTDQLTVVRQVLQSIARSRQVRPVVFMDAELPFLTETDAPGVTLYRTKIKSALGQLPLHSVLHEQLIQQMNQAGEGFHILILKTTLTVPYTSVFLRLDCKYWSDDAEKKLREDMKRSESAAPALTPQ
jgi:hypothetical protein